MMSQSKNAELEWLRHEFGMGAEQYETVVKLHASHDVECLKHCDALEKSNIGLLRLMRESTEVTPEIKSALKAATELRERCRHTTLQHIYDVSRQMEPEAAQRYREMMTARLVDTGLHHHIAVSPEPLERHDEPQKPHGHQPAHAK